MRNLIHAYSDSEAGLEWDYTGRQEVKEGVSYVLSNIGKEECLAFSDSLALS